MARSSSAPRDYSSDAWQVCKQFVEENLKAPKTADFPSRFAPGIEIVRLDADDEFEIVGYVDAQNSFGAMLRNDYLCVVRHLGNGNFRLLRLEFGSAERESERRLAEEARRVERATAAKARAREAEERERVAEEKRIADEAARERHRLAVIARRQREEAQQRETAAQMPAWHAIYRRELAPVRNAVGQVTAAWSRGSYAVPECAGLEEALARVNRQALAGAPDPVLARALNRLLLDFDQGAAQCVAGRRFNADTFFASATKQWAEVVHHLRKYGLEP